MGAAIAVTLPALMLLLLGIAKDVTLAVEAVTIPTVALVLQEWRPRRKRPRITLIGKSLDSPFSADVLRGLRDRLDTDLPCDLAAIKPDAPHESGTLDWQLATLRRNDTRSSDALVVIPAGDYEPLWHELRHLTDLGIEVVVVDVKAPNRFFYGGRFPLPRFVTSDHRAGGTLVGKYLASRLASGAADVAMVLLGPGFSPPAEIRNRSLTYELLPFGKDRLFAGVLGTWDEDNAVHVFTELTERLGPRPNDHGRTIAVFCGNDKNLLAIGRFVEAHPAKFAGDSYDLIGYDGIRNREDQLVISTLGCALATVDTRPRIQGRNAAGFLVDGYKGEGDVQPKNAVTEPRLMSRPWGDGRTP